MRILVTNDDGVSAPGLAALTRALAAWAERAGGDPAHEIIVVAPSSNYSGAGAAVGSVTDHTTIPYQRAYVEGAETVEAYGLDASPALSVIAGALGAVGPKPDLVLSGINDGVNVGRSVLHSGHGRRRADRQPARHQCPRRVATRGRRARTRGNRRPTWPSPSFRCWSARRCAPSSTSTCPISRWPRSEACAGPG